MTDTAEVAGTLNDLLQKAGAALPRWMLVILLCGIISRIFLPAVGVFRDDGIYLSSARALAAGEGYVIDTLPGSPPNTKYPPLTSALLALPYLCGFDPLGSPAVFKVIPLLFLFVWLKGLARVCAEMGIGTCRKTWVLCLTASSPMVAYCATMPLSDVIGAALLTWAVACILKGLKNPGQDVSLVTIAGLLLGLAVLARTAAFAVLPCAACSMFLLRRAKWAVLFMAAVLVIIAPWVAWVMSHPAPSDPVLAYFSALNYATWWAWDAGESGSALLAVVVNCVAFLLEPARPIAAGSLPAALVIGLCLTGLAVVAKGPAPARQVLLMIVAGILALAVSWLWPPGRIAMCAYPLLYTLIAGGRWGMRAGLVLGAAACFLCVSNAWDWMGRLPEAFRLGSPPLFGKQGDDWKALQRMAAWLAANTKETEPIASLQDGALPLLTGRPVVFPVKVRPASLFYGDPAPPLGTMQDFVGTLRRMGIRFIALTQSSHFAEASHFRQLVQNTAARYGNCMRQAASFGDGYEVYEFRCSGLPFIP
jgi:hypothetical protein